METQAGAMRLEEVWRVGYERQLIEITLRAGESATKRIRPPPLAAAN